MKIDVDLLTQSANDMIMKAADAAARQIPPLWPLASQVAVNPYLGQTNLRLAETAARLGRIGGGPVTMPRQWYLDRIKSGAISNDDLAAALAASPYPAKPVTVEAMSQAFAGPSATPFAAPTIAHLAADVSAVDWPGFIADRIGVWAATHFDAGQALWTSTQGKDAWAAYRLFAAHDITPEITGLKGFAAIVADAPHSASDVIARVVARLGIGEAALPSYFHQILLSLGGCAQFARYLLWRAELAGGTDATLTNLLAIRLLWEEALFVQYQSRISSDWSRTLALHAEPAEPDGAQIIDEILQEAWERAKQRTLSQTFASPEHGAGEARPHLQAAFCIDVRSEVFRRALESVDPGIRTLGFAGFFGMFVEHRRFASDVAELRLPVLLNPTAQSNATTTETAPADQRARIRARALRAWGRFKMAAVSSFAFVEAMGPVYGVKLLRDAARLRSAKLPRDPKPHFESALDLPGRVNAAQTILRGMSLTSDFARIVLLAGHGANVTNNPHASGLHCGACGGYSGEVNARLLADILNDREVRIGLLEKGIRIPEDTLFIAALHDTTTDNVILFDSDVNTSAHVTDLDRVRSWLLAAGKLARTERAVRLPRARKAEDVPARARDWSEVRPEWGLAGCFAFIAAPRSRTTGRDLAGRAFLHDYDWRQDSQNGFSVLELIMTAPVVVASWIALQYYGSAVSPAVFGAGNKLLHNVVGGIGVVEGNGGFIRAGLPWQSVHDGERFVHEPLRLTVCVEAPREAIADILARHPQVRALFDNRWLHLLAFDETGQLAWRYAGDLAWQPMMAS